jgi:hypothetical protein
MFMYHRGSGPAFFSNFNLHCTLVTVRWPGISLPVVAYDCIVPCTFEPWAVLTQRRALKGFRLQQKTRSNFTPEYQHKTRLRC